MTQNHCSEGPNPSTTTKEIFTIIHSNGQGFGNEVVDGWRVVDQCGFGLCVHGM